MRVGIHSSYRLDQYIAATVGSAGTAVGAVGECPQGYVWYVERLTCYQSGAAVPSTALLEIFVMPTNPTIGAWSPDVSRQYRQDLAVGTDVDNDVSDQLSAIVVPPGWFLVAYWSGLTSADIVSVSMQTEVRRLVLEQAIPDRHQHRMEHRPDDKPADVAAIVPADTVAAV